MPWPFPASASSTRTSSPPPTAWRSTCWASRTPTSRSAVTEPGRLARIRRNVEKALTGEISLERAAGRAPHPAEPGRRLSRSSRASCRQQCEPDLQRHRGQRPRPARPAVRRREDAQGLGLVINSAHVSTYGERVVDVFYVKDVLRPEGDPDEQGRRARAHCSTCCAAPRGGAERCRTCPRRRASPLSLVRAAAHRRLPHPWSRAVMGFVRDMLIAAVLGAGAAADAFFVSFKLANLLRRLFAEGAFDAGFVPLFGRALGRGRGQPPAASPPSGRLCLDGGAGAARCVLSGRAGRCRGIVRVHRPRASTRRRALPPRGGR